MSHPRGLTEEEAAAWEKVSATVEPLHPVGRVKRAPAPARNTPVPSPAPKLASIPARTPMSQPTPPVARRAPAPGNLDSHWDKRLKSGEITPDLSLDLHDHGLDAAYSRLMDGMSQARSVGARVVLLVTGRPRPVDPADRASSRGVIRSKVLDWLAASEHGEAIAAIRKAHRRHGGDGALYIVLRRQR